MGLVCESGGEWLGLILIEVICKKRGRVSKKIESKVENTKIESKL